MPGDVREELARDRKDELVVPPNRRRIQIDVHGEAGALALGLPRDGTERLLEAALLKRHRMERHHRFAELSDGPADDLMRPGHLLAAGRCLDQVLVRGQQALKSVVVDQLGDAKARAILGFHHLRDELLAVLKLSLRLGEAAPQLLDLRAEIGVRHSRRPRLMPSATAAARSDTPSFS